jgi:Uma2 family endonuclease
MNCRLFKHRRYRTPIVREDHFSAGEFLNLELLSPRHCQTRGSKNLLQLRISARASFNPMVQAPSRTLTLETFLQLPETKPASEYIHGQVIQKPMPKGKHSRIQGKLLQAINAVLEEQKIAIAFPELRCTFGDRSTVPDITVFLWDNIPRTSDGEIADAFTRAPDWTIEILSPDQSQTKVTKNILHCLRHGTQMGWLIDPAEKTVFVYRPKEEVEVLESSEETLPTPSFAPDIVLTLQTLFDWLKL